MYFKLVNTNLPHLTQVLYRTDHNHSYHTNKNVYDELMLMRYSLVNYVLHLS